MAPEVEALDVEGIAQAELPAAQGDFAAEDAGARFEVIFEVAEEAVLQLRTDQELAADGDPGLALRVPFRVRLLDVRAVDAQARARVGLESRRFVRGQVEAGRESHAPDFRLNAPEVYG